MRSVDDRYLIVVSRGIVEVWQGKQIQQRQSLRTDAALGDSVIGKRGAGERIDHRRRSSRKISRTLCDGRHAPAQRVGIAILNPLVAEIKRRSIVFEDVRNLQRAAGIESPREMVIGLLGRVLAGQRVCTRVERRIINNDSGTPGIERSCVSPVIPERSKLRKRRRCSVVHSAVDQQTISGALIQIVLAEIGEGAGLWRRLVGRRRRSSARGGGRIHFGSRRRCVYGVHNLGMNLRDRKHLQFEYGVRGIHFLLDGSETRHLHPDRE